MLQGEIVSDTAYRGERPPGARNRRRSTLTAAVLALAFFPFVALYAQDDRDEGLFEVRSASMELVGGVYYVSASIDFRLSKDAQAALESGLPLTVRLEVELIHRRRFWWDHDDARLVQRYQIEYHALTERYIVRNLATDEQPSFATLFSALNYLGRIEQLPFIDASLLEPGRNYDCRVRAVLDADEFTGPMRLLTFWRRDFSLSSEWFQWPFRSE
jgi:hypothetical protein